MTISKIAVNKVILFLNTYLNVFLEKKYALQYALHSYLLHVVFMTFLKTSQDLSEKVLEDYSFVLFVYDI